MEVTPTSKYLIYTFYCFPVSCAACCAEHQHYFTGEVTAATAKNLCFEVAHVHIYTLDMTLDIHFSSVYLLLT